MNWRRLAGTLLVTTSFGCSSDSTPPSYKTESGAQPLNTSDNETHYDRIVAASSKCYVRQASLCERISTLGGDAGMYVVERLVGRTELTASGERRGTTYVHLRLLEAWSDGAAEQPVARIAGGPTDDGGTVGWFISLEVGQVIGAILKRSSKGETRLDQRGLFVASQASGLYSGEGIYKRHPVDATTLGEAVSSAVRAGINCKRDAEVPADKVEEVSVSSRKPTLGRQTLATTPPPEYAASRAHRVPE